MKRTLACGLLLLVCAGPAGAQTSDVDPRIAKLVAEGQTLPPNA